jgi:hypothetical protein
MKILGYLIVVLLVTGCRELFNFPKDTLVRIQNNSNYDLKIVAFEKNRIIFTPVNTSTYQDTIFLEKSKYIDKVVAPKYSGLPYFESGTDSIVVTFDSKKILIQSCNGESLFLVASTNKCSIINNLNGLGDVVENKSGKYERIITYKITQSDYDRAVDL